MSEVFEISFVSQDILWRLSFRFELSILKRLRFLVPLLLPGSIEPSKCSLYRLFVYNKKFWAMQTKISVLRSLYTANNYLEVNT